MRLYNIYYICKTALEDLNTLSVDNIKDNANVKKLNHWNTCRDALYSLYHIEFFQNDIKDIYILFDPVSRENACPTVTTSLCNRFLTLYNKIIYKITAIIDLYESMRDNVSNQGIDIKLPTCNTLKEYIDILRDINFVFEQCPYLKNENEEFKYKGTDIGSEWITYTIIGTSIATGSFVLLNHIAILVNKAIALRSNKKVLDMQEELCKSMQAKNELSKEIIDAFDKMKEITYKKYVDELKDEIGEVADGEEEGKVEKSLEKLANLIDKGVEIHSSIETPSEIKVLFPFSESQQYIPNDLLKYLEDKTLGKTK